MEITPAPDLNEIDGSTNDFKNNSSKNYSEILGETAM